MDQTDAEVEELLAGYQELLEAMRRLTTLSERLLERAVGKPLNSQEEHDARGELETARRMIEELDGMLAIRRQRLRPM